MEVVNSVVERFPDSDVSVDSIIHSNCVFITFHRFCRNTDVFIAALLAGPCTQERFEIEMTFV